MYHMLEYFLPMRPRPYITKLFTGYSNHGVIESKASNVSILKSQLVESLLQKPETGFSCDAYDKKVVGKVMNPY